MADVALEVLITSVLNATGYRMNEAEAAKLKTTIAQVNTISTATNEADAKGTEKLVLKKRELAHIINALGGQAVPELGKALSMFAYGAGPAAAIFALAGVFELVKRHIEAAKKAAEDLAEAKWDTLRQSIDEAVSSANDLADALEKARTPADSIKVSFEGHKALLEAQIEDHKKLLELMEQEDVAAAKGDKEKEAAIHARYAAIKRETDLKAEQAKIDLIQLELVTRRGHAFELQGKAEDARAAVSEMETDPVLLAAQAALKGKDRGELVTASGSAPEALHMANEVMRQMLSTGRRVGDPEFDRAERMQREAVKRMGAVDEFDNNTQIVAAHTEAVRRLKEKVATADAAMVANQTAITEETTQRDSAMDVFKEHQRAASQQAALGRVDAAGGLGNAGNIIAAGVSAESAIQNGQKVTKTMAAQIATMHDLFESMGGNATLIIQILRQSLAHHATQAREIKLLQQQFANLKSAQMRGSPTGQ